MTPAQTQATASIAPGAVAPIPTSPTMPDYRREGFARSVAARVRNAPSAEPVFAAIHAEQQALIGALSNPQFGLTMAAALVNELKDQQPNAAYHVTQEAAQAMVAPILENRIRDAQGFVALLADPAFRQQVSTLAAQPATPAQPYQLPDVKREEILRRLVQPNDPAGAEPPIHVAASAMGQRIYHQALADLFRPSGVLRPSLVHALAQAAPSMKGEEIEALAQTWLKLRHDPAHTLADILAPEGELYREAMRRAELVRSHAAPAPTAPTPAPAAPLTDQSLITTPATYLGRTTDLASIVMDV